MKLKLKKDRRVFMIFLV